MLPVEDEIHILLLCGLRKDIYNLVRYIININRLLRYFTVLIKLGQLYYIVNKSNQSCDLSLNISDKFLSVPRLYKIIFKKLCTSYD